MDSQWKPSGSPVESQGESMWKVAVGRTETADAWTRNAIRCVQGFQDRRTQTRAENRNARRAEVGSTPWGAYSASCNTVVHCGRSSRVGTFGAWQVACEPLTTDANVSCMYHQKRISV